MPAFIETQFPIARLSAESYKERKAVSGQTLTGLGKWWGRKPLILVRVRAGVLGLGEGLDQQPPDVVKAPRLLAVAIDRLFDLPGEVVLGGGGPERRVADQARALDVEIVHVFAGGGDRLMAGGGAASADLMLRTTHHATFAIVVGPRDDRHAMGCRR